MGYQGREIEVKLHVQAPMDLVIRLLAPCVQDQLQHGGESKDTYWGPGKGLAQFVRMREFGSGVQFTVKQKDKGEGPEGNTDRVELDIGVTSSAREAWEFLTVLLGQPLGVIRKSYVYWQFGNTHDTISVYRVKGPNPGTFVEVEGRSWEVVELMLAGVKKALSEKQVPWSMAPGSLFEMYISEEVPHVKV